MVYDHFQHPGNLYVGSNHGVTRIMPAKWRLPKTSAEQSFGRLVLGFPSSGLLVWKPGDAKGTRVTAGEGLPGQAIGRMFLDRMVSPWALYVPTDGGLAVFRKL
jgi:hypothetical protein